MRSYTPEYSTGVMGKGQGMRHGRERGDVNTGTQQNGGPQLDHSWTTASGGAAQPSAGVGLKTSTMRRATAVSST